MPGAKNIFRENSLADHQLPASFNREGREQGERAELVAQFSALLPQLERTAGPIGMQLLGKVLAREKSVQEFSRELESAPDFREFQELALAYLERLKILERKNGQLIVDLEKIRDFTPGQVPRATRDERHYRRSEEAGTAPEVSWKEYSATAKKLAPYKDFFHDSASEFLFNAFYNHKVISREEAGLNKPRQGAKSDSRPLFYSPESNAAAFDVDKIKASDFHLGLWEVRGEVGKDYSPFHEGLPHDETSLACIMYHPRYGNGERNERGELEVDYFRTDRGRGPVSHRWLNDDSGYYKKYSGDTGSFIISPRTALQEGKMPHLAATGLLKVEDFRQMGTSEKAQEQGFNKPLKQQRAMVTLNDGIRYTLGQEFGNKRTSKGEIKFRAHQIAPGLGGITELDDDGQEHLVRLFDLLSPDDKRLKPVHQKKAASYLSASKDTVRLRSFQSDDTAAWLPKRTDEPDAAYEERVQALTFETLLRVKEDMFKKTGVSLEQLVIREQVAFADFYRQSSSARREHVYDFVKVFKRDGLRTFLALHIDQTAADKILAISERYSVPQAAAIFEKYASLIDRSDALEKDIETFFTQSESKRQTRVSEPLVSAEMVNRASRLLFEYATKKEASGSVRELLSALDQVDEDLVTFGAIFKTAFKGKKEIDFSEVRGLDLVDVPLTELSSADRKVMLEIARKNWSPRGGAGEKVVRSFEKLLQTGSETTFSILKKENKVIAFVRFDAPTEAGHRIAGSFNVDPDYRGSAIGEAMILNALNKQADQYVLEATMRPGLAVGAKYIEETGFCITGVISDYEKTGESFFTIVADKNQNKELISRSWTMSEIIQKLTGDSQKTLHALLREPEFVMTFDKENDSTLVQTTELATRQGFVITRLVDHPRQARKQVYVFEKIPLK